MTLWTGHNNEDSKKIACWQDWVRGEGWTDRAQRIFRAMKLSVWYSNSGCACMLGHFTCVWLFATLWTVAHQAPLSMGFSKQEYWSGLPCSPPEYLSDSGIKPAALTSRSLAGGFFTTSATWEAPNGGHMSLQADLHYFILQVYWGSLHTHKPSLICSNFLLLSLFPVMIRLTADLKGRSMDK